MRLSFDPLRFIGRNKEIFVFLTVFSFAVFAMLPQVQSISDLLWAEDGTIFTTEAFLLGWTSITTPYAGYIHVFPRLIAMIPTIFGMNVLPYVFLGGWFLAVGYALIVIFMSLRSHDLKRSTAVLVCLAIFVLPSSGEIYFNMTNCQWFLGLGLCAYFIIPNKPIFNWRLDIVLLPILALTGPFSAILLPFSVLKVVIISKNFRLWHWRILILCIGTVVQAGYFLSSSRTGGTLDLNVLHWLSALDKFLTYGIVPFGFGISVAVWVALSYLLKNRITKDPEAKKIGYILLGLAFALFAVSLWSTKATPDVLHPMGGGARYYFVPYALILLSWMFLLEWNGRFPKKILMFLVFIGLLHAVLDKTLRIAKSPIDYTAFVNLNRAGEAVEIQLNPFWDVYPSRWHIKASIAPDLNSSPFRYILTPDDVIDVKGSFNSENGFTIDDSDNDPYIAFSVPDQCRAHDYLAVKATMRKETDGHVELFWQTQSIAQFTPFQSRSRFMPKGEAIVHFAIQNDGVSAIRLDPAMDSSKSTFQSVEVICYD